MEKRLLFFAYPVLLIAACTTSTTPTAPTSAPNAGSGALAHVGHGGTAAGTASADDPNSAAHDDKGYIDGWFNGEDVRLYYTKSFFCDPLSATTTVPCELGGPPDTAPRPGPIPTIYAIAAAPTIANLVDPTTLACRAGTPCLNHPLMIDLSRIGGSSTAGPAAHNHILTSRGGGWFHTVNIRVFSLAAWNEIAAAKTLAKVRELQGHPSVGTPGVISADTPTNIFFFIAGLRPEGE
ncbi:hypothetical protein LuPra_02716 [Luteitalea pratensis]|uniref:Uncharacterized protein n=2 Tax=Luteitalea pratensis TaxID=1855912 RepID=A0A143PNY9_LUTPR|nr:hypothetical protein LuPra_02716 [Luteitalea pratensis]